MIFLTAVLLVILSLGAVSAQEANNSLQLALLIKTIMVV